ncbi:MAG: DUF1385 domain-containing protein [Bacteriovoracia bacterium]
MSEKKYTNIGGQAVIEGVMMRSPHYMTIAVRKPNGTILLKEQEWKGIAHRLPIFKKPFLRGVLTLFESMWNGIEALSYSASIASQFDEENTTGKPISNWALAGSMLTAFAFGIAIFVAAPHLITVLLSKLGFYDANASSPLFHLVDGVIKVFFLVTYIYAISFMDDIRRVFQYHGAEHKSIYAFEANLDLTVENASKFTTQHPRCGTSFLLLLLVTSIVVFSVVFPILGINASGSIVKHLGIVLVKIVLMLPVASISYELIRLSAKYVSNPICKALIFPGLSLQNLTTKEPDPQQLEVALAALKRVLLLEKHPELLNQTESEIESVSQIQSVAATAAEFPG